MSDLRLENKKLMLFDLDGTLLRTDKTISGYTRSKLEECRGMGLVIGVCTSRSESNSRKFTESLRPELVISSGGALVTYKGEVLSCSSFSADETDMIISKIREVCGDVNISADTPDGDYYCNCGFTEDEYALMSSWGRIIPSDFDGFSEPTLKICAEIFDEEKAMRLRAELPQCDCIRFTDGYWYKFTRCGITKESAIERLCAAMGIGCGDIVAFGDDLADIGMLTLCGMGVAMGNAPAGVKNAADIVIGTNDDDGIALFLDGFVNTYGRMRPVKVS
ncbi:MAG: HAD family phosphatase [Oscillospiraceae bacterium]|nr:HAD family phosphatase [Oscillospiraceae bacterium]